MKKNYYLQSEIEYIFSDKLEGILECEKVVLWEKFSIKWSSSLHTDKCNHEGTNFLTLFKRDEYKKKTYIELMFK